MIDGSTITFITTLFFVFIFLKWFSLNDDHSNSNNKKRSKITSSSQSKRTTTSSTSNPTARGENRISSREVTPEMAEIVYTMFPYKSPDVIRKDIAKYGSVEATVDAYVTELQLMQGNTNNNNRRTGASPFGEIPLHAAAAGVMNTGGIDDEMQRHKTPPKGAQVSAYEKYVVNSSFSSANDDKEVKEVSSEGDSSKKSTGWAKTKAERSAVLKQKQAAMVLRAREKMLSGKAQI